MENHPTPAIDDWVARINALTRAQQNALGWLAIGQQPRRTTKTLQALAESGLVKPQAMLLPGWPPVTLTEYIVLLPQHMAWCAWCEEQETRPRRFRRAHR